jgi:DNA-binding beta-propeller fold protein YncE
VLSLIAALGLLQFRMAPAQAAPFAYLSGSDALFVLDTATNIVVTTLRVGGDLVVHPARTFVYVASCSSFADGVADGCAVAVSNTATNTVAATVPVGRGLSHLAVHPSGTFVYAATRNGG